jgi:hypothetical protein
MTDAISEQALYAIAPLPLCNRVASQSIMSFHVEQPVLKCE